jgi:putative N6-adenine-specific DNA methylase
MVAKTQAGFEQVLAKEIKALGGTEILVMRRAVSFKGDETLMQAANLWLRSAVRILIPFHEATAYTSDELYKAAGQINWSRYLNTKDTFVIDCVSNSEYHHNSLFASLRVKDAIADQMMARFGERPSVDLENPTLRINLHIIDEELIFALDSSGDALQKRGYRLEKNEAPLNEVLAAGMILLTEWDGKSNLGDLMCGSGTLLIEGASFAMDMAPGLGRAHFGFQNWKEYDSYIWEGLIADAKSRIHPPKGIIFGSDVNAATVEIARRNIERAGMAGIIKLQCQDFLTAQSPEGVGILVMNPPYGDRLQVDEISTFYARLGNVLKQQFNGYDAWILSGNHEAIKRIGLRASKKFTLMNGSIECRFHRFDLYRGRKPEANA